MKRGGGLLVFLLGFGAGVASSFWYANKRADREIEDVKEHFRRKFRRERPKSVETEKDEECTIGHSWSSLDTERPRREEPIAYSKKYQRQRDDDDNSTTEEEPPHESTRDVYDENDPPFEISANDYLGSRNYEHVQLTWFDKDKRLVKDEWTEGEDMDGPVIYDTRAIVGDVFDRSGFLRGETDVIFVRNPQNSTDYEITFSRGGYLV